MILPPVPPHYLHTVVFPKAWKKNQMLGGKKKKKQSQVSTIDIKSRIFEEDTRFKDSNT